MLTDEQKLQNFASDTLSEAEGICREIMEEVENEKKRRLNEIENQIQHEIYDYLQGEISRIRKANTLELSQLDLELRQTLLKRREEISAIIYNDVRDKLIDFTKSAEYKPYLFNITSKALGVIGCNCDIYMSVQDKNALESELLAHISTIINPHQDISAISFVADKNIKIGGIRFYERVRGLMINETLDDKLDKSRDSFGKLLGPIMKKS